MAEDAQYPRPTVKDVVIRMAAIDLMRGRFDQEHYIIANGPGSASQIREAYNLLKKTADQMQPQKLFSKAEWELFYQPLGSWTEQTMGQLCWMKESIGVLAWALGIYETLPPYDQPFDVPAGKLKELIGTTPPSLRDEEQINLERENAQMWNWRARTTIIIARGEKPPPGMTFDELISKVANHAHEQGGAPKPIGNDFPAFGKPYRNLSHEEAYVAYSIAQQRHYAFNWLCGYGKDWDSVPTDT